MTVAASFLSISFAQIGWAASLSFGLFGIFVCLSLHRRYNFQKAMLRQISFFLLIITLINTLIYLFIGDVSGRFNGISTSAAILGFNIERPLFYFSNGVNHYGILLGFFICFLYLWFKKMNYYGSQVIRICVLTWLLCQFFLLIFIIDSRGALLSIVVGIFVHFFFKNPRYVMYAITLIPIGFILLGIFVYFGNYSIDGVSREGSTLFSHRELIWLIGLNGLTELPLINLLFGSGASGYINYDFGEEIVWFFADRGGNVGSLHNMYLQAIYEYGLLGIFFFISAYIYTIKKLHDKKQLKSVTVLFAYLFTAGGTESVLSLSYLVMICLAFGYSGFLIKKKNDYEAKPL